LPQYIEVDVITLIDLESQILIKDLKLPEGVESTAEPEEVVISVNEAREEEPETPTEEPDMESIEVEGESKEGEPETPAEGVTETPTEEKKEE
jgi:large subunit ribosomal protein L25